MSINFDRNYTAKRDTSHTSIPNFNSANWVILEIQTFEFFEALTHAHTHTHTHTHASTQEHTSIRPFFMKLKLNLWGSKIRYFTSLLNVASLRKIESKWCSFIRRWIHSESRISVVDEHSRQIGDTYQRCFNKRSLRDDRCQSAYWVWRQILLLLFLLLLLLLSFLS